MLVCLAHSAFLPTADRPNLNHYIFLRVSRSVSASAPPVVELDGNETLELHANDQHILPYKCVSSLLADGVVQLI